jgi:hypothetical protein
LAHSRDGGRPSWRPVFGAVLSPLWHQGHMGTPRTPAGGNYARTAAAGSGGYDAPPPFTPPCVYAALLHFGLETAL